MPALPLITPLFLFCFYAYKNNQYIQKIMVFFSIFLDVPNVSIHSLKGFSTNLKAENTVNMISMFSLLPAVANVVSYTQSIPKLFPNYSHIIPKLFPNYSKVIPKLFTNYTQNCFKSIHKVQLSPAVMLPPITLFSQLLYFELCPKKFKLRYFSIFPPSYNIFSSKT